MMVYRLIMAGDQLITFLPKYQHECEIQRDMLHHVGEHPSGTGVDYSRCRAYNRIGVRFYEECGNLLSLRVQ